MKHHETFSIQMLTLRGKKGEKKRRKICGPMLKFFSQKEEKNRRENLLPLREDREQNTGQGAELYNVHFVV